MLIDKKMQIVSTTILCALLLLSPMDTQAASDEDLAAMRAQLLALSERLDRLEAENRTLTAANAEMAKRHQETALNVAAVSEKTAAIAIAAQEQPAESAWTDKIHWKGDFRYRFENFEIEDTPNRNRNRIRARAQNVTSHFYHRT